MTAARGRTNDGIAEALRVLELGALPSLVTGGRALRLAFDPTFHRLVVATCHGPERGGVVELLASGNARSVALGRRGVRGFSADEPVHRVEDIAESPLDSFPPIWTALAALSERDDDDDDVHVRDGCGFCLEVVGPGMHRATSGHLPRPGTDGHQALRLALRWLTSHAWIAELGADLDALPRYFDA